REAFARMRLAADLERDEVRSIGDALGEIRDDLALLRVAQLDLVEGDVALDALDVIVNRLANAALFHFADGDDDEAHLLKGARALGELIASWSPWPPPWLPGAWPCARGA